MWWTRGERRRRRGGRGGACCGRHGCDDQDGVDGAAPSRTTARARLTGFTGFTVIGFAPPGPCGRARRRAGGRILVTVVSMSIDVAPAGRGGDVEGVVAVEPDRTQLRLPAPGEQRASRQQNRRGGARARSHVPMASASGVAPRRAGAESAESGRRGSGYRAHAASCACAFSMRTGLARAAAQGRPKLRRMRGGRPGWGAHLWMVGWYPWAVKRLVTT